MKNKITLLLVLSLSSSTFLMAVNCFSAFQQDMFNAEVEYIVSISECNHHPKCVIEADLVRTDVRDDAIDDFTLCCDSNPTQLGCGG